MCERRITWQLKGFGGRAEIQGKMRRFSAGDTTGKE